MDIPGFFAGVNMAVSAYKTAVKTLDDAKITAATQELDAKLIEAGAHILTQNQKALEATERERTLLGRIHDLEDQVRQLEDRASERDRYELMEDYPGTFAYSIKDDRRGLEPPHYLCPGCLDNRSMKSILQFNGNNKTIGHCFECKSTYRFRDDPPIRYAEGADHDRY